MGTLWPTFESEYLQRVCDALRARSKSIRYLGDLHCEAGVEVNNEFHARSETIRYKDKRYYEGGLEKTRNDLTEGLHIYLEKVVSGVTISLMIWELCVHLEIFETVRKRFGKKLLRIEALEPKCEITELVDVFAWSASHLVMLFPNSGGEADKSIVEEIRSRWVSLAQE